MHRLIALAQVKPEFAAIERAAISEPGVENSLAREHYTEDTEKVGPVASLMTFDVFQLLMTKIYELI